MCTPTIIDASVFGKLGSLTMQPFWKWMKNGNGVIVYTDGGKYDEELRRRAPAAYERFLSYRQSGQARLFKWNGVQAHERAIASAARRSNDAHIIALARASDSLILCTCDGDLKEDFLDKRLLPAVQKKRRAVYPSRDRKKQQDFLRRRECSLRLRGTPDSGRRRSS